MPKFNNVELSQETILATRKHFADNAQGCIDEVLSGGVVLPSHTDREEYFRKCRVRAVNHTVGSYDHTWTFLQRAYWIQTGECVALLP